MKSLALIILPLFIVPALLGSELGGAVKRLEEPTIENAKLVLEELDILIARGDPRTVTLGKKMHRSVKRLFTKKYKINEGREVAEAREAKAKQFDGNARQWLKPNIHGKINKLAASAAFRDARELRRESQWAQEKSSKEWFEEVADYERMLGDLQFSKENEALITLGSLLIKVVKQTSWVDQPPLKYDEARIQFIRERVANTDRWLTLAAHADDAGELELSYDFYRKAGSELGRFRAGKKLASQLESEGHLGSAINLWKRLGEVDRANELRGRKPKLSDEDYKSLEGDALTRNVAPACVRISTANGHETGFFYKEGGYVVACKRILLDQEGRVLPVSVTLENGQSFKAKVLGVSKENNIAALKIKCRLHELLPIGDREDLKSGLALKLFGLAAKDKNIANVIPCTVLSPMDYWKDQPTSRLALDASRECRGGPIVDQRGRVMGIFLTSKTGSARSLEAGAIHVFLKRF
ncbi:MAG: serine protease [Akkermansiaceae bacterium]|nr:serine protease [Akkermansiaceae bacterium]